MAPTTYEQAVGEATRRREENRLRQERALAVEAALEYAPRFLNPAQQEQLRVADPRVASMANLPVGELRRELSRQSTNDAFDRALRAVDRSEPGMLSSPSAPGVRTPRPGGSESLWAGLEWLRPDEPSALPRQEAISRQLLAERESLGQLKSQLLAEQEALRQFQEQGPPAPEVAPPLPNVDIPAIDLPTNAAGLPQDFQDDLMFMLQSGRVTPEEVQAAYAPGGGAGIITFGGENEGETYFISGGTTPEALATAARAEQEDQLRQALGSLPADQQQQLLAQLTLAQAEAALTPARPVPKNYQTIEFDGRRELVDLNQLTAPVIPLGAAVTEPDIISVPTAEGTAFIDRNAIQPGTVIPGKQEAPRLMEFGTGGRDGYQINVNEAELEDLMKSGVKEKDAEDVDTYLSDLLSGDEDSIQSVAKAIAKREAAAIGAARLAIRRNPSLQSILSAELDGKVPGPSSTRGMGSTQSRAAALAQNLPQ